MYNAIPMQKRWILTFHEKGLHFRSGSSGSSLHGTGGVAQTSEFLRRDLHAFGLDTVVVLPERILRADKTLRDAT